jgi:cyclic pyranopterin phosphate synthase
MKDHFGRNITYLRISVTDKCNLRCSYCMPEEGVIPLSHADILSVEETIQVAEAAASLGITKIRITGGEPLVRKGIVEMCRGLIEVPGIEEICMTTNGTLLPIFAKDLWEAGVRRLNISLDTLDSQKYTEITRGGNLEDALNGLRVAQEIGFLPIKINVVLLKGFNDNEIADFVALTKHMNVDIRFIELMPIGCQKDQNDFLSCDRVLEAVPSLRILHEIDGVSDLYQLPDAIGRIGLIRAISCKFCNHCNKIRLTADGKLIPCLHSPLELPIRGLTTPEQRTVIEQAILLKPLDSGTLDETHPSCASRNMHQIGG